MKKSEILKKIKCEILDKKESKQITGGYSGSCSYPLCPPGKLYPPHGSWIYGCGYMYYDNTLYSWCRPNYRG